MKKYYISVLTRARQIFATPTWCTMVARQEEDCQNYEELEHVWNLGKIWNSQAHLGFQVMETEICQATHLGKSQQS